MLIYLLNQHKSIDISQLQQILPEKLGPSTTISTVNITRGQITQLNPPKKLHAICKVEPSHLKIFDGCNTTGHPGPSHSPATTKHHLCTYLWHTRIQWHCLGLHKTSHSRESVSKERGEAQHLVQSFSTTIVPTMN